MGGQGRQIAPRYRALPGTALLAAPPSALARWAGRPMVIPSRKVNGTIVVGGLIEVNVASLRNGSKRWEHLRV